MMQLTRTSPLRAFLVYKKKSKTVYKCCKSNSERYSRDCQRQQFNERKKHCKYISELESLEQEKLYSKGYSVTNNETLSTKL